MEGIIIFDVKIGRTSDKLDGKSIFDSYHFLHSYQMRFSVRETRIVCGIAVTHLREDGGMVSSIFTIYLSSYVILPIDHKKRSFLYRAAMLSSNQPDSLGKLACRA